MALSLVLGALSFHAGGSMLAVSTRAPIVNMGPAVPSVGEFVYGAPVPLSTGWSRAGTPSTPSSVNHAAGTGGVVQSTKKKPGTSSALAHDFVYGAPVPASKGLPGFSEQKCF